MILGGTKFLGRAVVAAALARGHDLTLFTRGETNPGLWDQVPEKLRGDRDGKLDALRGREWDAVVDTSGQIPRVVAQSVDLLRDAVPHYTFVSSLSVYADFSTGPSETSPVRTKEPPDETDMEFYGERKAACERVVTEAYGDAALIVRPGLIVGPHDPTGRFTYWAHRIARGGDVLSPEPRDGRVELIDVRDLGGWMVRLVEQRATGVYNATGPERRMSMAELLEAARATVNPEANLAWVDAEFLRERDVGEWMELPLWLVDPEWTGMLDADVSKAVAAGLTFRPLEETIRGTLAEAALTDDAGMNPEREAELLAEWAKLASHA